MAKFAGTTAIQRLWLKIKDYAKITTTNGTTSITIGDNTITPQDKITSDNKLSADLITDGSTNKVINVKPNWNAASGDAAEILNKPTIPTVNNGTFSIKTKVGSANAETASDFTANQSGTDDVTFIQGDNVTLTTDASNRTITIASTDNDTKNTAGSTDISTKIYLVGASSQAANPQTYSDDQVFVTNGDLSANKFNSLTLTKAATGFSIAGGTTSKTLTVGDNYTLGAACAKAVDSSISSGSSSTNVPTSAAVASFVSSAISAAQTGAAAFQGTTSKADDYSSTLGSGEWKFSTLADYKKGNYWVVATAGTYAGQECEAGDFIFCISDRSSSYSASDFSAVQNNIQEMGANDVDTAIAAAEATT